MISGIKVNIPNCILRPLSEKSQGLLQGDLEYDYSSDENGQRGSNYRGVSALGMQTISEKD